MKNLLIVFLGFLSTNPSLANYASTQEYICTVDRSDEALGGDFLNMALRVTYEPKTRFVKFTLPNGNSVSGIASEVYQAKWNRTKYAILTEERSFILAFEKDGVWASQGGDPVPCLRK